MKSAALLRILPALAVMGGIFYLSHQPGDAIRLPDIPDLDKLLHSLVYGILTLTALYAAGTEQRLARPGRIMVLVVLFSLVYGLSDELHQSFVPGRYASLWDLAADFAGSLFVSAAWYVRAQANRAARMGIPPLGNVLPLADESKL